MTESMISQWHHELTKFQNSTTYRVTKMIKFILPAAIRARYVLPSIIVCNEI